MRNDLAPSDHSYLIERFPLAGIPAWLSVVATIALSAIALVLRTQAGPWLPAGFPYVTFFPAVIIVSFVFGARYGALAAAICWMLAWYYFIPPVHTFAIDAGVGTAFAFYAFVVTTDIVLVHWMQRANVALARQREATARLAATRALLFDELQHRVSNNLQVAAGLLSLQKRNVADRDARAALDEAARRLGVIGRISRKLYDPAGSGHALAGFLDTLAGDVIEASGRTDITHQVRCADGRMATPDMAVPIALIVAEAIANAIEHGFAGRGGVIDIMVADDPTILDIRVVDDGGTLPVDFDIARSTSMGLTIAAMLAAQIGGRFTLEGGASTTAHLTVPL